MNPIANGINDQVGNEHLEIIFSSSAMYESPSASTCAWCVQDQQQKLKGEKDMSERAVVR